VLIGGCCWPSHARWAVPFGRSSGGYTIQCVQPSILPNLRLKLNLPSFFALSALGIIASLHVEFGAVPFCVVWDQLLGLHLACGGQTVGTHSGHGFSCYSIKHYILDL
jgi:hypothetical protein